MRQRVVSQRREHPFGGCCHDVVVVWTRAVLNDIVMTFARGSSNRRSELSREVRKLEMHVELTMTLIPAWGLGY